VDDPAALAVAAERLKARSIREDQGDQVARCPQGRSSAGEHVELKRDELSLLYRADALR
jgi:hypothetical protein